MIPACQPLSITVKNMTNTVCLNTEDFSTRKNGASDQKERTQAAGVLQQRGVRDGKLARATLAVVKCSEMIQMNGTQKGHDGTAEREEMVQMGTSPLQ